jgi:hypothetical protein
VWVHAHMLSSTRRYVTSPPHSAATLPALQFPTRMEGSASPVDCCLDRPMVLSSSVRHCGLRCTLYALRGHPIMKLSPSTTRAGNPVGCVQFRNPVVNLQVLRVWAWVSSSVSSMVHLRKRRLNSQVQQGVYLRCHLTQPVGELQAVCGHERPHSAFSRRGRKAGSVTVHAVATEEEEREPTIDELLSNFQPPPTRVTATGRIVSSSCPNPTNQHATPPSAHTHPPLCELPRSPDHSRTPTTTATAPLSPSLSTLRVRARRLNGTQAKLLA